MHRRQKPRYDNTGRGTRQCWGGDEEAIKAMTRDRRSGSLQLTDRGACLIRWGICRRPAHSLLSWPSLPIPSSLYSILPRPQVIRVGCGDLYLCASCVCTVCASTAGTQEARTHVRFSPRWLDPASFQQFTFTNGSGPGTTQTNRKTASRSLEVRFQSDLWHRYAHHFTAINTLAGRLHVHET